MDKLERCRRKEYGEMVHRRRKRRSISMEEMSNRVGISQEAFARIEHGQVSPDIDSLLRRVINAIHQEKMVIK
ncbi:helix-turn-helix domain-containing protein [Rossellomorea sp. NPDC071047]|uniref:helix-turn-helix domain-containing protein n=1 Tax=Rossellomorea sp. NPDC071047 TaxID=3390675 RepID=UPI003CFFB6ED